VSGHKAVVLHYMSKGRRAVSSAHGTIVVLSCVSERRRAVSSTRSMMVALHYVLEGRCVVSSLLGNGSAIYWDLFLCQM